MNHSAQQSLPQGPGVKPPIFYGWRVVAAVFIFMTFSSGLGFYNLSVILAALIHERGFSVSLASGATATFFIVSGFAGLGVAKLIDRFDPRYTIIGGAALASLSILALGHVSEGWQVYVVHAIFGIGFATCNMVPGATLVARWFERRRAQTLSIASTGLSVGGILLTPLSVKLIGDMGLTDASPWIAALYFLGCAPIALMIRADPFHMGLGPDGDPVHIRSGGMQTPRPGTPYADAIRSRFYRFTAAAYLLIMLSQVGGFAHLFNLVATHSGTEAAAAAIIILASTSAVGRLLGGWIAGRISLRKFTLIMMAGQMLALIILSLAETKLALYAGAVTLGLTIGNLLMLQPLLYAQAFGVRDYPRIYSLGHMISTFGLAAGPLSMGLVHDWYAGYSGAYAFAAVISLLSAILFISAGTIPKYER